MLFSVTGYALTGGVNRFSHNALDSLAGGPFDPNPIELSALPSSSTKLRGAFGIATGLLCLAEEAGPEATNMLLGFTGLWIATGLPGLPFPTSPMKRTTGGHVAVAVGVNEGV